MTGSVTLLNAPVWLPDQPVSPSRLHFAAVVLDSPAPGATTIDLSGYTIFPGLVNAHDHLELNHYPRSRFRTRYDNAHQWGDEFSTLLDKPPYAEMRAYPLDDRLFIGGLKNLLSGVTTVAHHNPPHKGLFQADFPVRVLKPYTWSHSLHFDSEANIASTYRATPPETPWFIHLAEGTDTSAAGEYRQLSALGCVEPNTVLIHGVGLTDEDIRDGAQRTRGLVWCPSTNRFLLGQTAPVATWLEAGGRLAIGSDSRLTADGDLLDELRAARHLSQLNSARLLKLVLCEAAELLGLADAGHLRPGAPADFSAIRSTGDDASALIDTPRAGLALVVKGGIPQIGDPDLMRQFPGLPTVHADLDGRPKLIHRNLARRLVQCSISEPGLYVDADAARQTRSPLRRWMRRGGS